MRYVLKQIAIWIAAIIIAAFMCASCTTHYTMIGDTFTVVSESAHYPDSLSKYVLEYKDNRIAGTGEPISELEVILHKDVFEVGDKVKLVKIEK